MKATTIIMMAQSRCSSKAVDYKMTLPEVHLRVVEYLCNPASYVAIGSSGTVARLDAILQGGE